MREVLANPRNGGLRGIREIVNEKTGTRAQWYRVIGDAVWPGVVTAEVWRATMDRIHDTTRPGWHEGYNRATYLLPNIARCGLCDHRLVTGGSRKSRRLRCSGSAHLSRRADYIEGWVEQVLVSRFQRGDVPILGEPSSGDAASLRAEAVAVRARLDGIAAKWADGVIDDQQLQVGSRRLKARLAELDERIVRMTRRDVTTTLRTAADASAAWLACEMDVRRAIVRQVIDVWVLPGSPGRPGGQRFDPASVRIVWRSDEA